MHTVVITEAAAAKRGADFNDFIRCWIACEFPPQDQLSFIFIYNNTSLFICGRIFCVNYP